MTAADLARWEGRWRDRMGPPGGPEPFLVEVMAGLTQGRVLDVAAGDGRNALWLASHGLAVTAVDIAPAAIARLEAAARERGLEIAGHVADLDAPDALAGLGRFAALVVIRFKPSPEQWIRLLDVLEVGGRVYLCSFSRAHHAAHNFPPAYCLDRTELVAQLKPRLQLLQWSERETGSDHLAASVWVASRDAPYGDTTEPGS